MNKMAKLEHPPHARTAHLRSTSDLCNPASLKRTSPPLRLQIHPTPARWALNSAMVPNRMTKSWMDKSPQLWNCLQVDVSAFTTCGGGGSVPWTVSVPVTPRLTETSRLAFRYHPVNFAGVAPIIAHDATPQKTDPELSLTVSIYSCNCSASTGTILILRVCIPAAGYLYVLNSSSVQVNGKFAKLGAIKVQSSTAHAIAARVRRRESGWI